MYQIEKMLYNTMCKIVKQSCILYQRIYILGTLMTTTLCVSSVIELPKWTYNSHIHMRKISPRANFSSVTFNFSLI